MQIHRKCQLSYTRPNGRFGQKQASAVAAGPGKNLFGWEFADREDVINKHGVWIRAMREPGSPPLGLWNMHQELIGGPNLGLQLVSTVTADRNAVVGQLKTDWNGSNAPLSRFGDDLAGIRVRNVYEPDA